MAKATCRVDDIYRNLEANGAAAIINLNRFPGTGMCTFVFTEKVPGGRIPFVDMPRGRRMPDGRKSADFFEQSIASGELTVATLMLSDPLDNSFARSFVHPLWILWLQIFVPIFAFATFCDALAVVTQEHWRRADILARDRHRLDEPALIGWTVRGPAYHAPTRATARFDLFA